MIRLSSNIIKANGLFEELECEIFILFPESNLNWEPNKISTRSQIGHFWICPWEKKMNEWNFIVACALLSPQFRLRNHFFLNWSFHWRINCHFQKNSFSSKYRVSYFKVFKSELFNTKEHLVARNTHRLVFIIINDKMSHLEYTET